MCNSRNFPSRNRQKNYNTIKTVDPQCVWIIYVDDRLHISNNKNKDADQILSKLNTLHPNIKFTEEKEKDNKINYLDLTITREKQNLKYAIYRKPTNTSLIIPKHSNHPPQHKMATFHSLIHRMYNIPLSPEETTKERNIIYQIADENGYSRNTVNKIENKIKYKYQT
jgi:hypothetical protein